MTVLDAIILGLLQGLTEFLPVSSSGHLVLAQELLNISHEGDISFEVFVHFGTCLSVVAALREEVVAILVSFFHAARQPRLVSHMYRTDEFFRLGVFILLGSLPAAVVGLRFEHDVEVLFNDPKLVSVMLMITGFILFLTRKANPNDEVKVGLGSSMIIGIAQAVAVIPGISRSGSTISAGLFCGVSRQHSAKFSFLLALPVILGATLLKTRDLFLTPLGSEKVLTLFLGTVVSAISGYFAILVLLNVLRKRRFSWFAYYCFLVGILGILFIG